MADKILPIRLPDDWHAAIDAEAKKQGTAKSALLKKTLGRYLKSRGHKLSEPPKWGGSRAEKNLGKS